MMNQEERERLHAVADRLFGGKNVESIGSCTALADTFIKPIFVPMDEIDCRATDLTKTDKHGFVTIKPKGNALHGYCCSWLEQEATMVTFELCGTIEPDKWLGRLSFMFHHGYEVDLERAGLSVPTDGFDRLRQPINAIALIQQSDGCYQLIGCHHTTAEFFKGGWMSDSIHKVSHAEIASYQPLPDVYCRVPVNVTDCTSEELLSYLVNWMKPARN